MKQRTAVKNRIWIAMQRFVQSRAPVTGAIAFFAGFLMANAGMYGKIAPFGIALAAGVPASLFWPGALGALCGYLVPVGSGVGSMKYIAALCLVMVVRQILKRWTSLAKNGLIISLIAFGSLVIPSLLSTAATMSQNTMQIVFSLSEAALAGGGAYLVSVAGAPLEKGFVASVLERKEHASIIAVLSVMLLALCGFEFLGFSLGRFAAVLMILCVASAYGPAVAAGAGVVAGVVSGLNDVSLLVLAGVYGFAGLFAGLFYTFGRFGASAAFVLANGILVIAMGVGNIPIQVLYEVMAATVLFMVLPQRIVNTVGSFRVAQSGTGQGTEGISRELHTRLALASSAMREVRTAVDSVSERLRKINADDITTVYDGAAEAVCARCSKRMACWGPCYNSTMGAFHGLGRVLKEKGTVSDEDFPHSFLDNCSKVRLLCTAVNEEYERFRSRERSARRFGELRAVVSGQFEAMGELLDELSEEALQKRSRHVRLSEAVREYLESTGIYPREAVCELDLNGRITLTITIDTDEIESISRVRLARVLSRVCKRELALPSVMEKDGITTIRLKERARFEPIYGEYQSAYRDGRLCGDSIRYLSDGGRVQMVLSDGMGSGPAAAVDSAMASSLLTRMMSAGLGATGALKFANAALLTKSAEESLATADIALVDLHTGRADLYKAGAAPTFVRSGGKVVMLEGDSLPIGILNGISADHTSLELEEGDILLMVSDGAVFDGGEWIVRELEAYKGDDMQALAKFIVETAKQRRNDGHEDDISAAALMLTACREQQAREKNAG